MIILKKGNKNDDNNNLGKLSLKERISYGMLDTAGQLVFAMISSYLLYFYTDVAGISIAAAGMILLIARLFDGIDATIWGIIIDNTTSKYGKCRPYFLWLALPFSVFGILTFLAPNLNNNMKIAYAMFSYVITGIIYTGMNTPLTAILPLLTDNPSERVVLNSFRMTGSQIGVLIVNATALPLIAFFGNGNDKNGFAITIMIFSIISLGMNLFSFKNLKERVTEKIQKVPFKKSLSAIKGNWPWIIIVISNFMFWIALTARTSTIIYYFTYNLNNKGLVTFMNSIASLQIIAMIAIPFICKKISKTSTWMLGLIVAILGQFLILFAGQNIAIVIFGWIIGNMGSGVACSMPFALLGSAVDFGQWKNGIKSTGFLTAIGSSFCIKAGSGIGGALPAWIMGAFGYIPHKVQTISALIGIKWAFIGIPLILFLLALIPLIFYKKYEGMENTIRNDLRNASL